VARSCSGRPCHPWPVRAAYEFSGNADDSSGNGFHRIPVGASPTADRFGAADSAHAFDGQDDWKIQLV